MGLFGIIADIVLGWVLVSTTRPGPAQQIMVSTALSIVITHIAAMVGFDLNYYNMTSIVPSIIGVAIAHSDWFFYPPPIGEQLQYVAQFAWILEGLMGRIRSVITALLAAVFAETTLVDIAGIFIRIYQLGRNRANSILYSHMVPYSWTLKPIPLKGSTVASSFIIEVSSLWPSTHRLAVSWLYSCNSDPDVADWVDLFAKYEIRGTLNFIVIIIPNVEFRVGASTISSVARNDTIVSDEGPRQGGDDASRQGGDDASRQGGDEGLTAGAPRAEFGSRSDARPPGMRLSDARPSFMMTIDLSDPKTPKRILALNGDTVSTEAICLGNTSVLQCMKDLNIEPRSSRRRI